MPHPTADRYKRRIRAEVQERQADRQRFYAKTFRHEQTAAAAPHSLAILAIFAVAAATGLLALGLSAALPDLTFDHTALVALTSASIATAYGIGSARLVGGYLHRRDRPPSMFAKQVAVLIGSVPSVAGMAFALLYASIWLPLSVGLVVVYGSSYLVIIRQFVEKPPTKEEILAVLRRVLSLRFP